MRARGGTRTGFRALNFRHSPANIRNPAQSGTSTTRSEAQGVHIVHTLFLPTLHPVQGMSHRFSDAGRFGRLPFGGTWLSRNSTHEVGRACLRGPS